MKNPIIRFLKEPLLHFLAIGACIYGAFAWFGEPEEEAANNQIVVDSGRINAFITEWQSRWNRPPTAQEIDGLIQSYVREEVLYRQAIEMGLNEGDAITRRRMAQKLEFLTSDIAQAQQPAEGELEQYFQDNAETYRAPDRITFLQVFFNPDSRKDATLDDAKAALAQLQAAGVPDLEKLEVGDKSMIKNSFEDATEFEVRRQMGTGFAESVMNLDPGKWHGPVLSGYGVHLVYVYDLQEGASPELATVKDKVLGAWHDEQREKFNAEFLKNLMERYEIVIAEVPADRLIKAPGESVPKEQPATGDQPSS